MSLKCLLFGHDRDDGEIVYDIPFHPETIPNESLRDGYVCMRRFECQRCSRHLESEIVPDTEENREEYYDWFEQQHGIRPST